MSNEQRERRQAQAEAGRLRRELEPGAEEFIEVEPVETETKPAKETVKPPEDIAVFFAQKLRYFGPWKLAAIVPDGPPNQTMTAITPRSPEEVRNFVAAHNGKRNLHYEVNPGRTSIKKSSKADIIEVQYLHADLDPRPDETPAQGKQRFRKKLAEFGLQPTFLVDSGNGFNCLWKLDAPLPPARFEEVEIVNKALVKALGSGDISAWNVDRLLRLPGTINLPNKAKREQGRVRCQSAIVHINDAHTTLELVQAALDRMSGRAPKAEPATSITAEVRASDTSADTSADTSKRLPPELLKLVRAGVEEPRRSQQFFRAVHWLRRLGWQVSAILALMQKYPGGIASKYEGRLEAEVERAFGKVEDDQIEDEFEDETEDEGDKGKVEKRSQADLLVEMAKMAELYHNPNGVAFADIVRDGHRETYAVHSLGFKDWLTNQYLDATDKAPNPTAMSTALATIGAKARYRGEKRPVFLRVGGHDGKIYYDLCDEQWRVVEIDGTTGEFRLLDNAPVRFERRMGMLPQVVPVQGGSTKLLHKYANVSTEDDFILFRAFLLACLRDRGPYPILNVTGEQGTAKSSLIKVARALVDPNTALYTRPRRSEHELFITARNSRVLAFDNLSSLSDWMSDAFASITTGSGYSTRALWTNDEEQIFTADCPIMLNGIVDVVSKGDLAEREVALYLRPITEDRRKLDEDFWKAFEVDKPAILGGLLKAVALGLQRLPETHLDKRPRMADFARFAVACGDGWLWKRGKFMRAYTENQRRVTGAVLADDPVAIGTNKLIAAPDLGGIWTGTMQELLKRLEVIVGETEVKRKDWPGTTRALRARLDRIAPLLRRSGIDIDHGRRTNRARLITITVRNPAPGNTAPRPSTTPTSPVPPASPAPAAWPAPPRPPRR
jgi:hypothetical protein